MHPLHPPPRSASGPASDKYARARLARTRAGQMSAEKNVDILGWYDNLPKHPKSDYAPITRIRKGEPFINHDL